MNKHKHRQLIFWLLFVNGFAFVATAMMAFVQPLYLAEIAGLILQKGIGTSEFLANYGGLYLLIGIALSLSAFKASWQVQGLLLLVLVCGGLFIGRAVAVFQFGFPALAQMSFAVWEGLSAALAVWLWSER
ncbi:DUF4345 family protein [Pelagibaculum spongiae]|uniref:DUF4345 domain-containing protein n=1 Tax=Pelagibaculum spongiae TaxID=2080658 RepID=A0A2V1GXM1_9GAMM|nr:DUF4345 family protein [Pelagibaculum spongiae]PVZ71536.1 hypothetical protein DC094_00360 [Pelagibaculum spongiae]